MSAKASPIQTILGFPVVLAIGIVLIPVVADYSDHELAEQAVGQTARWFSGHLIAAMGFTLSIMAVVSIDRHLRLSSRPLAAMTLFKEENPHVVPGTLVNDAHNFGILRFSGPRRDRKLTMECWDFKGRLRWTFEVSAAKLRPSSNR